MSSKLYPLEGESRAPHRFYLKALRLLFASLGPAHFASGPLEAEVLSYLLLVSGRFTQWETPMGHWRKEGSGSFIPPLGLLGYLGPSPAGQSLCPDS